MTRRDLKHYRPGGLDPWKHNAIVARRKKYRRIALELRAAARAGHRAGRSFLALAASADRAARSLRRLTRAFEDVAAVQPYRRAS